MSAFPIDVSSVRLLELTCLKATPARKVQWESSKSDREVKFEEDKAVQLAAFALLLEAYTNSKDISFIHGCNSVANCFWEECSVTIEKDQSVAELLIDTLKGLLPTRQEGLHVPCMLLCTEDITQLPSGLDLRSCLVLAYSSASKTDGYMKQCLYYDPTTVTAPSAQRILSQFIHIRQQLYSGDRRSSSTELSMLTAEDATQLREWNAVPQYQDWNTIHGRVAEWLPRCGSKTAIDAHDGRLTRHQLDAKSDRVAQFLIQEGCSRGDVVAIIIARSVWVPVAILGVLKAGAAFVLIDQGLPFERLKVMTTLVSCQYALSSKQNTSIAMQLVANVVIVEDNGKPLLVKGGGALSLKTASSHVTPDDLAFVNFTSGSTGKPKAVLTKHSAWCSGYTTGSYSLASPNARCMLRTSYNFIVSLLEILTPLMNGGTICIPSTYESVNNLTDAVRRLKPNWMALSPSLARTMDPWKIPSIKTIAFLGEPTPIALQETWLNSPVQVIENQYGATEGCSAMSVRLISSSSDMNSRNIGKSILRRSWIVNPQNDNQLMPIGAVGELVSEGYSLASGYVDEPEKNAKAFIESPTWASHFGAGSDGRRFYKTGDLVKYNDRGELHLFGRGDAQVKLRGQRIEPAEVENCILEKFGGEIQEVVVDITLVARDPAKPRLTAFVILRSPETTDENLVDLHQRISTSLSQRLPSYMVPSNLVSLQAFPKTGSGKIKRRALKKFEQVLVPSGNPGSSNRHDSPADDEAFLKLRKVWSEVLHVNENDLSYESNFIELGGDSANAIMLSQKAKEAGFDISLADILQYPDMHETLYRGRSSLSNGCTIVDQDNSLTQRLENTWTATTSFQRYCYSVGVSAHRSLIHHFTLSIRGIVHVEKLRNAVAGLFQQYDSLRLTFSSDATRQMAIPASEAIKQRLQVIQCHETHQELQDILAQWHSSERPASYQPVKWTLLVSPDQVKILVRIHHTIMDGTSIALIFRSLQASYETGDVTQSGPQYLPYSEKRLSPKLPASFFYWRELLEGSKPTMLRKDAAALADNSGHIADISAKRVIVLPTTLSAGATLSTLIKSAWAILLAKMTRSNDVMFYYLLNGRDETIPGSLEVVGCCATEVPMRVRFSNPMTAATLLKQVQDQILAALPHAHLGTDTIARECASQWNGEIAYRHSSFLIHQNIDVVKHFTLSDTAYVDVDELVNEDTIVDFSITSVALGDGALEINVEASKHWYSQQELDLVTDGLVRVMECLSSDDDVPLEHLLASAESIEIK